MLMSLFSTIFVLLIAFFQGVQGLFSALIMAVLSILSAAAAFSLAEPAALFFSQWVSTEYCLAACFMLIFLICLSITRTLADRFIPGNLAFPLWVDRIGGGLCGLLAGLVVVGTLCIGVQMLPFGPTVLGFNRVEVTEKGRVVNRSLWLRPDGFTVELMRMLSKGSLSGSTAMAPLHPDWLEEIQWNRSGVQKESRHVVPAGALRIEGAWDASRTVTAGDGSGLADLRPGSKFIVVRASLGSRAADEDRRHRFTSLQWRLVGRRGRSWQQVPMRGMSDPTNPNKLVEMRPDEPIVLDSTAAKKFDVVFEVPETKDFDLAFVEYKRGARAELGKLKWRKEPLDPIGLDKAKTTAKPAAKPKKPTAKAAGRVGGRHALGKQSSFGPALPIPLAGKQISSRDAEVSGERLVQGHVVVVLGKQPADQAGMVKHLEVPADKRLLQLAVKPLFAKSVLGKARQFAVKTLRQYRIEDEQGDVYFPIGEYRLAEVGGERVLELQYWPNNPIPERALRAPRKVRERDLEEGGELTYLFLVPPGRRIVVFKTGTQRFDLTTLDLLAPE